MDTPKPTQEQVDDAKRITYEIGVRRLHYPIVIPIISQFIAAREAKYEERIRALEEPPCHGPFHSDFKQECVSKSFARFRCLKCNSFMCRGCAEIHFREEESKSEWKMRAEKAEAANAALKERVKELQETDSINQSVIAAQIRKLTEKNETTALAMDAMRKAEAQVEVWRAALKDAAELACMKECPTVWKQGTFRKHAERCQRIRGLLAAPPEKP